MLKRLRIAYWLRQFSLPVVITLISVIIQATPLENLLDLERSKVNSGQWWLLITGHCSHLDWTHWLVNNIALWIIWELFYRHLHRHYHLIKAWIEFLVLAVGVGLGIYWFNPEIGWYVGLSGILHGMFAIGIIREVLQKNRLSMLVAIAFIGKIVWEQTVGVTTIFLFSADDVLVDAHLYGAVTGVAIALCYWLLKIKTKSV